MQVNMEKIGARIAALRKMQGMTQSDLSKKLNISYQAVSKWERGKTLPDTAILIYLAKALDTSVDDILSGGETVLGFRGELSVKDMREGIACLENMRVLLGRQNKLYRYAIAGISEKLKADVDAMLDDPFLREQLIMEAVLHNLMLGYHFDPVDIKINFQHEYYYHLFCQHAKKYDLNEDAPVVALAELTLPHANVLAEIISTDTKLHHTLTPAKEMQCVSDVAFYDETVKWMRKTNSWSFVILANDHAVGLLSISKIDCARKTAGIGYWIGSAYWGQGIMTKAVRLAIEKAKQNGLKILTAKIPKTDDPVLKETDQFSEKIWQRMDAAASDKTAFVCYRLEL